MLLKLHKKYPESIITKVPPQEEDNAHLWLTTDSKEDYLAIPKKDLTDKETDLLCSLFVKVTGNELLENESAASKSWHGYLYEGRPHVISVSTQDEYRIIQFTIKEKVDSDLLKVALTNIFAEQAVIVFTSPSTGVVIEQKTDWPLQEEDLHSAAGAIEGDFYSSPKFFMGRFYSLDENFLIFFDEEKKLFSFAEKTLAQGRVFTFPSTFPSYALNHIPAQTKKHMFSDITALFSQDEDLKKTIKTYLENQSNTSQTAKALFMHRNSVQYRIDKFIEKIGIDIKTFQGALTVYLACLEAEQDYMEE